MSPILRPMILAGALTMLLAACGLKGPLYLPKKTAPPTVVPASLPDNAPANSAAGADADKQTTDTEASSRSSADNSGK